MQAVKHKWNKLIRVVYFVLKCTLMTPGYRSLCVSFCCVTTLLTNLKLYLWLYNLREDWHKSIIQRDDVPLFLRNRRTLKSICLNVRLSLTKETQQNFILNYKTWMHSYIPNMHDLNDNNFPMNHSVTLTFDPPQGQNCCPIGTTIFFFVMIS